MNRMMQSRSSYLAHYGVKGMKWGVRKDRKKGVLHPDKNPNLKKLPGYKGPAYFISESEFHGKTLTPRIPKNFMTNNGYEDSQTPRISFAPSVNQCLMGLSQNVSGKTYNVYAPADRHDFYKPNRKAVPDSDLTGELWVCEPIKVKKVGRIRCTGDAGLPGKIYSYGSNKAELYDWKYDWTGKTMAHSELCLVRHDVKSYRVRVRKKN